MADAVIELVGPDQVDVLCALYNQIFRPPRDVESIRRRFRGRYNILMLLARVDELPVGFFIGFELKPEVFFCWFYGVLPNFRRKRIATRLMDAVHSWARENDYESIRIECHNQHRPMLHLAISLGYDIVGLRWDHDRGDYLVIFEKLLN